MKDDTLERSATLRSFKPARIPLPRDPTPFPEGVAERPVDLEIGCGVGAHPISYARANPERLLIALERTATRFGVFERRLAREGTPKGLLAVRADAIRWVTHRVPPATLSRLFLLYPNPYPRPKQANQRWHRMPFFGYLLTRLVAGGTVTIASNLAWYTDEAEHWLQEVWRLEPVARDELTKADVERARTHFESKYLERGQRCVSLTYRRC